MVLLVLSFLLSILVDEILTLPAGNDSTLQFSSSSAPGNQSLIDFIFPYLIPYSTSQACDIFGPICQTGEITVSGLGKNDQPARTTLPCSSYLASQSTYVHELAKAANLETYESRSPGPGGPTSLAEGQHEWERRFGRSPQCTSYAELLQNNPGVVPYTFDQCPKDAVGTGSSGNDYSLPTQVPPGVIRGPNGLRYLCCSDCYFPIFQFRLYYFKEKSMEDYCRLQGRNATNEEVSTSYYVETSSGGPLMKRNVSVIQTKPGASVATVDGIAMTSPSMYLKVVGTVVAFDKCGTIGTPVVDPVVVIPSGGLSTYERSPFRTGDLIRSIYTGEVGWNGNTPSGMRQYVKSLNVNDLECPTYGVGFSTDAQGEEHATVGSPWLPFIIAPPQLLSLNSVWADYPHNSCQFAIAPVNDPPRAVNPMNEPLVDPTQPVATNPTPIDPSQESHKYTSLQPGMTPTAALPEQTRSSKPPTGGPPKEIDPTTGTPSNDTPKVQDPKNNPLSNDPPRRQYPPKGPNLPKGQGYKKDPPTNKPKTDPKLAGNDGPGNTNGNHVNEKPPEKIVNRPGSGSTAHQQKNLPSNVDNDLPLPSPSIGEAIATGFNGDSPSGNLGFGRWRGAADSPAAIQPLIIGGQTVSPAATGFNVGSKTIKPGVAVTMVGTRVSLDASGILIIGDETIKIRPTPFGTSLPQEINFPVLTAGGNTFQAKPSGFIIAGKSILPAGPAVIISGTRLSLGPSENLQVGSKTFSFNHPSITTSLPTLTAGGRAFAANPNGFIVAGITALPGGHAITISGTPISLGPLGDLRIGSQTIPLPAFALTAQFSLPTLTVGHRLFTPNPTGFTVADHTILPGGLAATISGTRISLASSGTLVIGSQTFSLPRLLPLSLPTLTSLNQLSTFTERNGIILANGFILSGHTFRPGSAAVTVSGTRVSLGTSGTLVIGEKTNSVAIAGGEGRHATSTDFDSNGAGAAAETGSDSKTGSRSTDGVKMKSETSASTETDIVVASPITPVPLPIPIPPESGSEPTADENGTGSTKGSGSESGSQSPSQGTSVGLPTGFDSGVKPGFASIVSVPIEMVVGIAVLMAFFGSF